MKIGLINLASSRDVGDSAILAALGAILRGHNLLALAAPDKQPQLPGIPLHPPHTLCNAYISVGGDIFHNDRPWLATHDFLDNLAQLALHGRQTLLFGQSIPASCQDLAFHLLCLVLKKLPSVTVRDKESWQRLRAAGIEAQLGYDLAFMHHPEPTALGEALALLAGQRLDATRTVLLSLPESNALPAQGQAQLATLLGDLCRLLRQAGLQPALLLISADRGSVALIQAIGQQVAALPLIDVLHPPADLAYLAPHELLQGLLALAGLTISLHYHTTVLALAAGRLPYNLHYSGKSRDLSERLGTPGSDLANFNPEHCLAGLLALCGRPFAHQRLRQRVEASLLCALDSIHPSPPPRMTPWLG